MYRFEITISWRTPILPRKDDPPELNKAVNKNLREWLISARIREIDKAISGAVCFLGFELALFLSYLMSDLEEL